MRIINIKVLFIAIYCFVAQCTITAQNQSLLLPIPGGTSNLYDGCKMINFINPSNTGISTLPKWTSYIIGHTGEPYYLVRPHNEQDLQNASPSMNEKYVGQHPMFAQHVVHDKNGNLLFFIVDNNIYNRYGNAFVKKEYEEDIGMTGVYSYLHDGEEDNSPIISSEYSRFELGDQERSFDPEILVFPIYGNNNCYRFGVVYSYFDHDANEGAWHVYYRNFIIIMKKR